MEYAEIDKSKKKVSQDENKSITELDVASLESKVTQVSTCPTYVHIFHEHTIRLYNANFDGRKDKYDK